MRKKHRIPKRELKGLSKVRDLWQHYYESRKGS